MVEGKIGDDRSMSEILASIRKIVTDEERARRKADGGGETGGGETGGGAVLELSDGMRAAEAEAEEPLDLGVAAVLVSAPPAVVVRAGPAIRPDIAEIEAIVRRVIREELKGQVGLEISRKVKASIREEVRRALEDDGPLI